MTTLSDIGKVSGEFGTGKTSDSPAGRSENAPTSLPGTSWKAASYAVSEGRAQSPALAAILSLMPGLGHVYIGYYQQGFINIVVVASIITLLSQEDIRGMEPFLGLFLAFYWLFNLVDAWRRATYYNQALAGIEEFPLPDSLSLSPGRHTLAGGILMILIGILAFSHTLFDVSLEWLNDWWPLGVILAGAYLVGRVYLDRKRH